MILLLSIQREEETIDTDGFFGETPSLMMLSVWQFINLFGSISLWFLEQAFREISAITMCFLHA